MGVGKKFRKNSFESSVRSDFVGGWLAPFQNIVKMVWSSYPVGLFGRGV